MWVEGGDIHDELLDQLGGVLAPPDDLALTPSAAELEALAAAVAARWPGEGAAPATESPAAAAPAAEAPAAAAGERSAAHQGGDVRRLRWAPSARRVGSSAWRAGSVAAAIVLLSASAAAAANGGVPLPRPVRVVAYTVGLPVDSPALDDTNQHIKQLQDAVKAKDKPKAEATVRRLQTDLTKVPADEKTRAVPKVEAAIGLAADTGLIPAPTPTTTTTMPPASSTTATTSEPSTTVTTAEEKDTREKDKEKPAAATTTTTAPGTTTSTEPATTTTTVPENSGTDPGSGTGDGGSIGDPGPTTTTTAPESTTTTTTAPPEETTTTTTTAPESTTTTTTAPPQPATVAPATAGAKH